MVAFGSTQQQVQLGHHQFDDLFAGPQGHWEEDGWHRYFAIPVRDEHEQLHHFEFLEECVPLREQHGPEQTILHDAHHCTVTLRGYDVVLHHHNFLKFGFGFVTLRDVHVHFIAVEVCVVGSGDAEVESEGGEGQDAHAVAHHTHFVQRGLPVEQHDVVRDDVAFDHVAHVQVTVQVDALA